jgi:hypothetical protein
MYLKKNELGDIFKIHMNYIIEGEGTLVNEKGRSRR